MSGTEPKPEAPVVETPAPSEPDKAEKPAKAPKAAKPKAAKEPEAKIKEKPVKEKTKPAPKAKTATKEQTKKKPAKKGVVKQKVPAKKPATKKKANGVRLEGMQINHEKRPTGPAMHELKNKLKTGEHDGTCRFKGCKINVGERRKWCAAHKKEVRTLQLKLNNVVWRERVERGVAGHHVVYDGRPTVWTATNKQKAERIIKAGHAVVSPEIFDKKIVPLIPKVKEALKS